MIRRIAVLGAFCLLLVLAGPAWSLEIIFQDPAMATYVVGTDEDLILVFDASLNPATVTAANVKVLAVDDGTEVSLTRSLETTQQDNDTLRLDPDDPLDFARQYEFSLTSGLSSVGGSPFSGNFPNGALFVCNIPNDMELPDYTDPQNFEALTSQVNPYLGFDPVDPAATDESKYWRIPGISITEAWKRTTGRPDVLIAVVDNGLESYGDDQILNRLFLNIGELPLPDIGGAPCGDYDCNGDGRINIEDYGQDSRLLAYTGGNPPNPEDAIDVFSDGKDDDGNGLVDDICGWDFFRDVNKALGVEEFPEGTHGGGQARGLAATPNDGQGGVPGVCPGCTVLPIRVSEAVMADANRISAGIRYAHLMGARIVTVAMGAMNYNAQDHQAIQDAYEDGMLVIAASGDELGFHHIYPAAGEDVVSIKSIFPFPPMDLLSIFPMELIAFTESYCTNFGAHVHLTVPAGHICTSEATGLASGVAGLLVSRALDLGIDLAADEVKQMMTLSTDDIVSRCVTFNDGAACQRGFDQHFGYGRLNARRALEWLGDPDTGTPHRIPPIVRMTTPRWWEPLNPLETPVLTVKGQIDARGARFHYQLEYARGVEPLDKNFKIIASGASSRTIDGEIATIQLGSLISPGELRRQPQSPNDKTVTFRLRAYRWQGGERIWGEARKAVTLFIDDDPRTGLVDSFPIDLGASGESSVVLADLDHDLQGRLEIVFATSDGRVHVVAHDADTGQWTPMAGFPVDVSSDHPHYTDSVVGSVAVGDLRGDGSDQIVVATVGGKVYAIGAEGNARAGGPFLPGFPVAADNVPNDSALAYAHGNAFVASPVLVDLDLDGDLEIIAGSYDQKVYAWQVDDGTGAAGRMAGWPVMLSSRPELDLVPWDKRCLGDPLPAQVLGSPAAFVIDPEHADPDIGLHPSVIVPTTETCEGQLFNTSRVYAVFWDGMDHPGGPFLPDWPAVLDSPLGDAIPIPPLTIGMTNAPAAATVDGLTQISVGGFFWFPYLLTYEGGVLNRHALPTSVNFTSTSNGTFAPIRGDDSMQFLLPTVGFLNRIDGHVYAESFNLMGWDVDAQGGTVAFRRHMDDIMFFINPVVADLNNDNLPEILAGSGGYLQHAMDINADQPTGFPKMTGHWIIASPAVGDMDRDGLLEVATVTHDGYLFAWETQGEACTPSGGAPAWPRFRHDRHNSGYLSHDATPPAMVLDLDARSTGQPRTYALHLTASGDDHLCGTVTDYHVRYATDPGDDLRDPQTFAAAPSVSLPTRRFNLGGDSDLLTITTPVQAVVFALRAVDEAGNLSPISNVAPVLPPESDDDDDTQDSIVDGLMTPEPLPGPRIEMGENIGCGC